MACWADILQKKDSGLQLVANGTLANIAKPAEKRWFKICKSWDIRSNYFTLVSICEALRGLLNAVSSPKERRGWDRSNKRLIDVENMTPLKEWMKNIKSLSYLVLKIQPWCHMLTVFQYKNCCKESNRLLSMLPPNSKQK